MKRIWLLVFILMVIPVFVGAVTDVNVEGNVIRITAIDATDWIWTDNFPNATNGLYIYSIMFSPAATNDECTFRLGSSTGNVLFHSKGASAYDEFIHYFPPGIPYKLYFDSDNPNDAAIVLIILR